MRKATHGPTIYSRVNYGPWTADSRPNAGCTFGSIFWMAGFAVCNGMLFGMVLPAVKPWLIPPFEQVCLVRALVCVGFTHFRSLSCLQSLCTVQVVSSTSPSRSDGADCQFPDFLASFSAAGQLASVPVLSGGCTTSWGGGYPCYHGAATSVFADGPDDDEMQDTSFTPTTIGLEFPCWCVIFFLFLRVAADSALSDL